MLHIKLKRITNAAKVYKIFCPQTPHPPMGSIGQNSTFFRTWSCCISNLRESQMQQHRTKYFACRPPSPPPSNPGDGVNRSKFPFFQNMVTLHIKFNRFTIAATQYQILTCRPPTPRCPLSHPSNHLDGVNWSKFDFLRTWSCCISD